MKYKQIFGCFSLRICVLTLAFSFINLAWSVLLVNGLDYKSHSAGFIVAMITVCLLFFIWGLTLYGVIWMVYKTILVTTILWSIFVVFWLMMVLISCMDATSALLVNYRGPESFWLMRNKYNRDEASINYEYYDHEVYEKKFGMCLSSSEKLTKPLPIVSASIIHRRDMEFMKWTLIVMSFSVFSYIIFSSWYVLYNFCKQLNYKKTCECPAVCNRNAEPV